MIITDGIHLTSTEGLEDLKLFLEELGWPKSRLEKIRIHAHLDVRNSIDEAIELGAHKVSPRTLVAIAYWHRPKAKFWLKADEFEGFPREQVWLVEVDEAHEMLVVASDENDTFEVDWNQAE